MSADNIRELESISEELMKNPNNERGKEFAKYLQSQQNFREVYSICISTKHWYLQYLCLNSILTNLSLEWKNFTTEEKAYLHASLYGILTDYTEKPAYLLSAICKTLSRICRIGWFELENARKTTEQILLFSQNNAACLRIASKFLAELVQEINDPIKNRSIVINRKVAIRFRDEALGNILNFAITNLINPSNAVECILENFGILNLTLNFDFSGTNNEEIAEEQNVLPIPLNWKQYLHNANLFRSLESMLKSDNDDISFHSFKALSSLCAVRKSIFLKADEKIAYCSFLYSCFEVSISHFILHKSSPNEINLSTFLQGIKKFLVNFLVKDLCTDEIFLSFIQRFLDFSFQICENKSVIFNLSINTIQVWTYLAHEGVAQTDKLKPLIPIMFQKYFDLTYELLDADTFEDESNIMSLIECLDAFSTYFYPEVLASLIPKLNQVMLNLENNNPLPIHISWSIYLCSTMLSNTMKKVAQELDDKLVENLAGIVPKLIQLGGHVEKSIIFFCQTFGSVYLSSSIDTYWGDSNSVLNEATVGQISMLVLEVIFNCFHKYTSGPVLNNALNLFEKLCSGYSSSKIISSLPAAFSLINYPQCNFTDHKMRTSLFLSLTQLWSTEQGNLQVFFELLSQKIQLIYTSDSDPSCLFAELLGISKALNTEKLFRDFFDVINEGIWPIVYKFKDCSGSFENFKHLFRFFTDLLENRNCRVRFDISEAHGVILFKNLSQVISSFSAMPVALNSNNSKVKLIIRLANNLFKCSFISFGVFEVYNDNCYKDTLTTCFRLINNTIEIQRYPNLLIIIFEFLDILCKSHQKALLTSVPEFCLQSMISFFIFAFKTEHVQVSINHVIIAAGSLFTLCEFIVKTAGKNNGLRETVLRVLERESGGFQEIIEGVFEILLYQDGSTMWAVNKVLLALAIIFEDKYYSAKAAAVSKFSVCAETRNALDKAFGSLFANVNKSLDGKNKDVFTKNFTEFKQTLAGLG